ncbi:MAG TPA: hypothetical protein VGN97_19980 [Mesorhizobium sp.]|jgi:hypothetical protein|nr:hypothetical protein [Mesorhizobium sp.]
MARYFFHIMDDRALVDTEGTEMDSLDAMRVEAIRLAGRVLADDAERLPSGRPWQMTVADESGATVFWLKFEADYHGR